MVERKQPRKAKNYSNKDKQNPRHPKKGNGRRNDHRGPEKGNTFVKKEKFHKETLSLNDGLVRLNKYIANAGICSRREADALIESGVVKVNGKIVKKKMVKGSKLLIIV